MRIEYIRFLNKKPQKARHCYDKNKTSYVRNCDKNRNLEKKYNDGMRKIIFNKNRVALVAISLMLVTASYWNYLNKTKLKIAQLGDATFVNSNAVTNEKMEDDNENSKNDNGESKEVATQDVTSQQETSEQNVISQREVATQNVVSQQEIAKQEESQGAGEKENSNYFTKLKLDREKMFSQMIDSYKSILENSNIANDQKKVASDEIKNINNNQNSITTIENLLKGKGFQDVVVLLNDNSTNVIVKSDSELKKEQVAQIENIVSRELNIEIEKIHISTHN